MSKGSTAFLESKGWKEEATLGAGGQAVVKKVYRADGPADQFFALKLLKSGKGPAYQRFHQEIEALRKIDHPNVVKVIDHASDETDTHHYYVMDYVPGVRPLKKIVGSPDSPFYKNPLSSLAIYRQVIQGLQACEKSGVVHRDLSLGNVLVTPDHERVVLIDFGCCYTDDHKRISLTDEAVGTINYRAPECEAFQQEGVTSRADLYSAGKVLWSLVTNKAAFTREEPVFKELALSKVLPGDPMTWHLHHVFEKTIRQATNNRYANAREALAHAAAIREIIAAGLRPLEQMAIDSRCPSCRVGELRYSTEFRDHTLVHDGDMEKGTADHEIVREMKYTEVPCDSTGIFVCTYCGFTVWPVRTIQQRNLAWRKTLF